MSDKTRYINKKEVLKNAKKKEKEKNPCSLARQALNKASYTGSIC